MTALPKTPVSAGGAPVLVLPAGTARLVGRRFSPLIQVTDRTPPHADRALRFVTSGDAVIDLPATAERAWQRPPYAMSIRLVAEAPASGDAATLGEVVIGTRMALPEVTEKIISAMQILLHAALVREIEMTAAPLPPPVSHRQGFLPARTEGRIRHTLHRWQDRLLAEEWAVGLVSQSPAALVAGDALASISWLAPTPFGDFADPHFWPGTERILCEEIPRSPLGAPGRIVALTLSQAPDHSVKATARQLILNGKLHRSYPGASLHNGQVLLLPETPVRGETAIYRLGDDGTLSLVCRLPSGLRVTDPTLFTHAGLFWIAYTDLDIGAHDNLCLMHAPSVLGPWTPHRGNPVKLDIRSSRPAGPLFCHNGALFRPAQDCARTYGAAVTLNRIEVLTVDDFREVAVRRIEPLRGSRFSGGLHTLATTDQADRILIDGKRMTLRPHLLADKVRSRMASRSQRSSRRTHHD